MLSRVIYGMPVDQRCFRSSGEGEVVDPGDSEHGVVDAVAFGRQSQGIFQVFMPATACSTRADLAVRGVVFFFPGQEIGPGRVRGGVG